MAAAGTPNTAAAAAPRNAFLEDCCCCCCCSAFNETVVVRGVDDEVGANADADPSIARVATTESFIFFMLLSR